MILAVVSRKGGVGKTTTAVSLAAAWAVAGRRVLLLDLDPNAGSSMSLGVGKGGLDPGSADLLLRGTSPWALVRPTTLPGLFLIPASVDLRSAEVELAHSMQKERLLQRSLAPLAAEHDVVVVDCPAGLGLLARNALVAADAYVLPVVPHFLALDGLEATIEAVDRMAERFGTAARLLGIVFTLVDYRVLSIRGTLARLRATFGRQICGVEIRTNVALAEAPAHGRSIFELQSGATGALAYALLREELEMRAARLGFSVEAAVAAG